MTTSQIVAALGVVLAVLFELVPGLSDWFGALDKKTKLLVISGLCLLIAVGAPLLACAGIETGSGAVCPDFSNPQVYWYLVVSWLLAAGAAQTTFVGMKVVKPSGGG